MAAPGAASEAAAAAPAPTAPTGPSNSDLLKEIGATGAVSPFGGPAAVPINLTTVNGDAPGAPVGSGTQQGDEGHPAQGVVTTPPGQETTPTEPAADGAPDKAAYDAAMSRLSVLESADKELRETFNGLTIDQAVQHGLSYVTMRDEFDGSPEGARQVIERLIAAASEQYGDKFEAPATGILDLDTTNATENEKSLLGMIRQLQGTLERERADTRQLLTQIRPVLDANKLNESAASEAVRASKELGVQVSPEQVVEAIKATGEKDAVKALKLHTWSAAPAPGGGAPSPVQAEAGRQTVTTGVRATGGQRTYDDRDPNLTADQELALLQAGFVPASRAQA